MNSQLFNRLGSSSTLWRPSREEIRRFTGSFCLPDVFDYIEYGDNHRIWTPATLVYEDRVQNEIISIFKAFYPGGHFVINLGGSSYHDDYPHIFDDPAAARKLIIKLLRNRLIPVCCATNDEDPDNVLESYKQNADVIDCSFVMWEMNGPCQGDSDRMFRITQQVREANPKAITYLHFTSGHGSMGFPENEWWKKNAAIGIRGLLSQDNGYDRDPDGDPPGTAAGLEDTARHLHGLVAGWEGLDLDNIAFEQTTTPVYHKYPSWNGEKQRAYGDYLVSHCPNIAGWCDGANVK